jgi:beta-glucanase (GH16 family)
MDFAPKNPSRLRSVVAILLAGTLLANTVPVFAATPTLIWSDDFNQPDGTGPDPTKWVLDLGAGLWGNDELEFYTDSRANSYVISDPGALDGKALVIAALKDPVFGTFTSARLQTGALFQASYGHIEARLRTTSTQGLWPAFWMLGGDFLTGTNWPQCGEVDILETINTSEVLYGTVHGPGYSIGAEADLPIGQNYSQAYHVVALDWEPDQLQWSVDGVVYQTVTPADLPAGAPWEFNNSPFFLLLNLAVGGDWPGNPDNTTKFPALYTIDYVRVYGLPPTAPSAGGATAPSPDEIDLSWSAPSDLKGFALTGYQITRATNPALTENAVMLSAGATPDLADTGVSGGVTYYYEVSAVSSGGISDPSPVFSATTLPPTPAILGPPSGQVLQTGSTLVLTASTGPGYTYQWSFTPAGSNAPRPLDDSPAGSPADAVSDSTGPQLVIANATPASSGTYTVFAYNSTGSGSASTPAEVSVTQAPTPGQLISISARAFVGAGDNVLIGGFYVAGSTSCTVLVQAIGPALVSEGVSGVLQHPALSIHQNQNGKDVTLYTNVEWGSQGAAAGPILANAAAAAYAEPALAPGSADSELLVTLPPGGYTAEITGADGGSGMALCAIYQLP